MPLEKAQKMFTFTRCIDQQLQKAYRFSFQAIQGMQEIQAHQKQVN